MPYFTRPEEVLTRMAELCEMAAPLLGVKKIMLQEESLIPEFPALQIAVEPLIREIRGTYTFENTFVLVLWVYHANFEVGHARRTIEDMQLATNLVNFLHRPDVRHLREDSAAQGDYGTAEDKVIFSYVSLETPGRIEPDTGPNIITTRLLWLATVEERFEHG